MNLNQVTISSTNVDRASRFYQKLGLRLIVESLPKYSRFECPDGNATFSIHHVEEVHGRDTTVYFECESLDQKVDDLSNLGVNFELLPTDQPWLWREAHLFDPDGNKLILFYGGKNRLNPPWRVN